MICRDIDPCYEGDRDTYCYQCKDAAIMAVNVAMAQLAELAADLHRHDDGLDDLLCLSPELRALLDRLAYIGHWIVAASDPDAQQQFGTPDGNYVVDWCEALRDHAPDEYDGINRHMAALEALRLDHGGTR